MSSGSSDPENHRRGLTSCLLLRLASLLTVHVLIALPVRAADVAITILPGVNSQVAVDALDDGAGVVTGRDFLEEIPSSGVVTSEFASSGALSYDIAATSMSFAFDLSIPSDCSRCLFQHLVSVDFISDQDVAYVLGGFLDASSATEGFFDLRVTLRDQSQLSLYQTDAEVGGGAAFGFSEADIPGRNSFGSLVGPLTGSERYRLEMVLRTDGLFATSSKIDANGALTLHFVPEPSTGILVSIGLLQLAIRSRWRTRA